MYSICFFFFFNVHTTVVMTIFKGSLKDKLRFFWFLQP